MRHLMLFFIIMLLVSCGDYCNDYLKPKQIQGKISLKYIDKRNHYLKKLVIEERGKINTLILEERNNELWDYLEEGDSIIKNANYLDIIIKKKNNSVSVFPLCY